MGLKNNKIIFMSITFTIFILFFISLVILNILLNEKEYNVNLKNKVDLEIKKIVLVGDSRMELIYKSRKKLNIPESIIFDAKNGVKIDWFYTDGIPNLYKKIENKNYKYYVIFNLGVNDLHYVNDVKERVNEYFKLYKNIVKNNENINFYFLSINPIEEKTLKKNFGKNDKKTNKKIEEFNKEIKNKISDESLDNFKYCDSYNSLDFVIPDGIHFDDDTNKRIINYILDKCINFNKIY